MEIVICIRILSPRLRYEESGVYLFLQNYDRYLSCLISQEAKGKIVIWYGVKQVRWATVDIDWQKDLIESHQADEACF